MNSGAQSCGLHCAPAGAPAPQVPIQQLPLLAEVSRQVCPQTSDILRTYTVGKVDFIKKHLLINFCLFNRRTTHLRIKTRLKLKKHINNPHLIFQ